MNAAVGCGLWHVLSAILTVVGGIHSRAKPVMRQIPLFGQDNENVNRRSFSWQAPGGGANVVVQRWQPSGLPSAAVPWGRSWSWSWSSGADNHGNWASTRTEEAFRPVVNPQRVFQQSDVNSLNRGHNRPHRRQNDVLKTVQNVKMPAFTRNHLKADSLSIQKALTDMVSNWVVNGGNVDNRWSMAGTKSSPAKSTQKQELYQSPPPRLNVQKTQQMQHLFEKAQHPYQTGGSVGKPVMDASVVGRPAKIATHRSPEPEAWARVTRQPSRDIAGPTMEPERLPMVSASVTPDTALGIADNVITYSKPTVNGKRQSVHQPDVINSVNNVKMPTFTKPHLLADSLAIQKALIDVVSMWATGMRATGDRYVQPAKKTAAARLNINDVSPSTPSAVSNQLDITDHTVVNLPPVHIQPDRGSLESSRDAPPPPIVPAPVANWYKDIPADTSDIAIPPAVQAARGQNPGGLKVTVNDILLPDTSPTRPQPATVSSSGTNWRDDLIGGLVARDLTRDLSADRPAHIIIVDHSESRVRKPHTQQAKPKVEQPPQKTKLATRGTRRYRPSNPSVSFLEELLFSMRAAFPLSLNIDTAGQVRPSRGGGRHVTRQRGWGEEPGEEAEL